MSLLRSAAVFTAVVLAAADVSIILEPTDAMSPAQNETSKLLFQVVEPQTEVACSYVLDTSYQVPQGEHICESNLSVDLSDGSPDSNTLKITFRVPSGHYIHLSDEDPEEESRIEFMAEVDCGGPGPQFYQEFERQDLAIQIMGVDGLPNQTVMDRINADSFLSLGQCDGCSTCSIFTRVEIDGPLDDEITEITWEAQYDKSVAQPGEQTYLVSTDRYGGWIRRATLEEVPTPPPTPAPPSTPVPDADGAPGAILAGMPQYAYLWAIGASMIFA